LETLFDLKPYEKPEPIHITVIDLFPIETECGICGKPITLHWAGNYSLPMYEGKVVNPDIQKEWAGYPICTDCYRDNEYKIYLDAFGIPRDMWL
jgi:hypothetical protein